MPRKRRKTGNPHVDCQPTQVPPLDERHYAAMELSIQPFDGRWLSRGEIAEVIGVSRMQLYRWGQREDYQREKTKLREKRYRHMHRQAKKAWNQRLNNGDVSAKLEALKAWI